MASPSDTTTTLNPGASGDSLDETLVAGVPGTVGAKRARVVVAGDRPGDPFVLVSDLNELRGLMSRQVELLAEIRNLLMEING